MGSDRKSNDEMLTIEPRLAEQINEINFVNRRLTLENEALTRIGQIISSSAGIDEIYEKFSEQLRVLIPFDRMSINMLSPEGNEFVIEYTTGVEVGRRIKGSTFPCDISASGKVARQRSGLTLQAESAQDIEESFPALLPFVEAGLHSFLYVPMITREQLLGIINLSACVPGFYTEDHLKLVERVSSPIAGAISIAKLYQERTILQEQLNQAQKMEAIGRLAGEVAHDFNNLLTPIIGYAQVGMKSLPRTSPVREQFQRIYEASERASQLVRQLLTLSRKEIIELKSISLNRVILGIDEILHRLIDENIELITRPKSDLRLAKMDKGQMGQVLVNLVVNARDAMPNGGRIIIETDDIHVGDEGNARHPTMPSGNYVKMRISDNGVGMPGDVRARIFEPFFTTKESGRGTGLGLSVCYGIVNQIEGHIFVDSELGQGTTFTIYLPSVDEEVEEFEEAVDEIVTLDSGTETLLLVEDEMAVREITAYVLREQGYTVLEAANGVEALEIFDEHGPSDISLLFTDVVMPGLSGKELSDRVRELSPAINVLYCSGYTEDTIDKYGIPDDGTSFLRKPFRPEQLVGKVREVLDRDNP